MCRVHLHENIKKASAEKWSEKRDGLPSAVLLQQNNQADGLQPSVMIRSSNRTHVVIQIPKAVVNHGAECSSKLTQDTGLI